MFRMILVFSSCCCCRMMRMRQNASAAAEKRETEVPVAVHDDTKNNSDSDGSCRRVFYLCVGVRMLNSLVVQTYFNPDEHWQSLEVAHRLVFGYAEF